MCGCMIWGVCYSLFLMCLCAAPVHQEAIVENARTDLYRIRHYSSLCSPGPECHSKSATASLKKKQFINLFCKRICRHVGDCLPYVSKMRENLQWFLKRLSTLCVKNTRKLAMVLEGAVVMTIGWLPSMTIPRIKDVLSSNSEFESDCWLDAQKVQIFPDYNYKAIHLIG